MKKIKTIKIPKKPKKKEFEMIIHQTQDALIFSLVSDKEEADEALEQTIIHTFKTKEELNAFQEALEHYAMEDIEELTREQYEHLQKLSSEE